MTERLEDRDLDGTEARLRAAVAHRVGEVDGAGEAASLAAVERRVRDARRRRRFGRPAFGVLAVAAAVAFVLGVVAVLDRGDQERLRTTGPGTAPSTTPAPTTAPEPAPPPADAVWPPAGHQQYADPVDAARSFLQEYLLLRDPPLSAFRPGVPDSQGEIDVYLVGEGGSIIRKRVVSTVLLRHYGDGTWKVTGARSDDIAVDRPRASDTVGYPVILEGRARGYEGTIMAEVVDGGTTPARPLGQAVGIAGSALELAPFHLEVALTRAPTQPVGSVLFSTDSGCTECLSAFAVVPVSFAPPPPGGVPSLRLNGIGPVRVGMTLDQAGSALAGRFLLDTRRLLGPEEEARCGYADAREAFDAVEFMVDREGPADSWRVARVEVHEGSGVTTEAGIGIGATEAEVTRAYGSAPGTLSVEPHPYLHEEGSYVLYDPDGPGGLLLLFETQQGRVITFRSGHDSAVRAIEGCA